MPCLRRIPPIAIIWIFFGGGALSNILFPSWDVTGRFSAPSLILIGGYLLCAGYRHTGRRLAFLIWAGGITLGCLGIEMIGVATGWPFGEYRYGPNLGRKLADVPLVMGIAWFELLLLAGLMAASLCNSVFARLSVFARPLVAAAIITTCDFLLEPAATRLGFWSWQSGSPPLQNYVAWFLISLVAALPLNLRNLLPTHLTGTAKHLLLAQMLYFGSAIL